MLIAICQTMQEGGMPFQPLDRTVVSRKSEMEGGSE